MRRLIVTEVTLSKTVLNIPALHAVWLAAAAPLSEAVPAPSLGFELRRPGGPGLGRPRAAVMSRVPSLTEPTV